MSTYEGCVIGLMVFADIMLFVIAAHITDILIRLRNKLPVYDNRKENS